MPATPTNQALSKPFILTSVSHSGVSAVDLATLPHRFLVGIAGAATVVAADWAKGNLKAETKDAEHLLDALSKLIKNLDHFHHPVVPSHEQIVKARLADINDVYGYPVLRDGECKLVKAEHLTAVEVAAVREFLALNVDSATQVAASFEARLAQFERQVATNDGRGNSGYVEAPAPDWKAI